MDLNSIKLSSLEKAMKARSALMFLTSLAFVDCYLILRHGSNLASLSFIWVKTNIDLSETILIAAFFTVTFGLLIPGVTIIGRIILGTMIDRIMYKFAQYSWLQIEWKHKRDDIDNKNYVNKNVLREWAVKTSNNAAYRDYERFEDNKKEVVFVRYMCQSFIALTIVGWVFAGKANPVFTEIIFTKVKSLPWYQEWPLGLVVACFWLFLFGMAFYDEDSYQDFIPLRDHCIPDPNNSGKLGGSDLESGII